MTHKSLLKVSVCKRLVVVWVCCLSCFAHAVELGDIRRFTEGIELPSVSPQPEIEKMPDLRAQLSRLAVGRPVIGFGGINIFLFVDFDEPNSLAMLSDLIDIVRNNFALRLTIVYYSPTKPVHDQAVAIFSMVVHKVIKPKRHLLYIENIAKTYGRKNAIMRSVKKAGIPARDLMTIVPKYSKTASDMIEENNKIGYAISKTAKAPVMVIGSRVVHSYCTKKEIKTMIKYLIKNKLL